MWHPHISRPYLDNDVEVSESSPILNKYTTSLIQIKNPNHFLKQSEKKLQCGCRFVKTDNVEKTPQEPISAPLKPELPPTPEGGMINNLVTNIARDMNSVENNKEIIQSLKNKLEENNKLISSLEQLLQNQNQKVMAPYLGMNMPQFLQMPVQPVQQGYYINPSMPMIQSYSLMNNGIQLPMLATMMPGR